MDGCYKTAVKTLKRLYNLLKKQMLSSEYIQIDESVICYIGKLYRVESELSIEERKEKRTSESYPVIVNFEKWM